MTDELAVQLCDEDLGSPFRLLTNALRECCF
jgi:hypothetical protein